MKKYLFIIGIFSTIMLFTSQKEENRNDMFVSESTETVQEINTTTDIHHCIEQLSDALQRSKLLTPRRQIQSTFNYTGVRLNKSISRISQNIRLKEAEQLSKVSVYVSHLQTINHSALLTRMGYHIYALRKIII